MRSSPNDDEKNNIDAFMTSYLTEGLEKGKLAEVSPQAVADAAEPRARQERQELVQPVDSPDVSVSVDELAEDSDVFFDRDELAEDRFDDADVIDLDARSIYSI